LKRASPAGRPATRFAGSAMLERYMQYRAGLLGAPAPRAGAPPIARSLSFAF